MIRIEIRMKIGQTEVELVKKCQPGVEQRFELDQSVASLGLESERVCTRVGSGLLDEHDSPQWYDIVHFECKLLWLCFGLPQKASYQ